MKMLWQIGAFATARPCPECTEIINGGRGAAHPGGCSGTATA